MLILDILENDNFIARHNFFLIYFNLRKSQIQNQITFCLSDDTINKNPVFIQLCRLVTAGIGSFTHALNRNYQNM